MSANWEIRSTWVLLAALFASPARGAEGPEDKSSLSPSKLKLPKGPGSLEGIGENVEVNFNTGQMSHVVKFDVPSGYAGHGPNLQLSYSSGAGAGISGIGWSLPIPSIERSTVDRLPRYLPTDEIVADGATELVKVKETAAEALYRARFEGGFARYTWNRRASASGGYWLVEYPDGSRSWYGADQFGTEVPNARVSAPDDARTFRWNVVAQEDVHGNLIHFGYEADGRSSLPARIDWARPNANSAPRYSVLFDYAERPDQVSDCKPGFEVALTRRLVGLRVLVRGLLLRRYSLDYEATASAGGLSRLVRVVTFGTDGSTPRESRSEFGYSGGFSGCAVVDGKPSCKVTTMVGAAHAAGFDTGNAELTDLNGDALPDVLSTLDTRHRVYLNRDGVNWDQQSLSNTSGTGAPKLTDSGSNLLDIDGDGDSDFLQARSDGTTRVLWNISTPTGDWAETGPATPEFLNWRYDVMSVKDTPWRFLDLDNDKRIDMLYADYEDTQGVLADGVELSGVEPVGASFRFGTELADINGDGLQDPVYLPDDSSFLSFRLNLGFARWGEWVELITDPPPGAQNYERRVVDLNGDALADVIWVAKEAGAVYYQLNVAGSQLAPLQSLTREKNLIGLEPGIGAQVRYGDMNGSGSTDIVWISPGQQIQYVELFLERPNLLRTVSNALGRHTTIDYGSSVAHRIRDAKLGVAWQYPVPNPMLTVERMDTWVDVPDAAKVGGEPHQVQTVSYRHGYWDPLERRFRGFQETEVSIADTPSGEGGRGVLTFNIGLDTNGAVAPQRAGVLLSESRYSGVKPTERLIEVVTHDHADQPQLATFGQGNDAGVVWSASIRESRRLVEGRPDSEAITVVSETTYDGYGNKKQVRSLGVTGRGGVGCGPCSDATAFGDPCDLPGAPCRGDESFTETTYVVPGDAGGRWILGLPCVQMQYSDPAGPKGIDWTYYDGPAFVGLAACKAGGRGLVSRSASAVTGADPAQAKPESRSAYDGRGMPIATLEARASDGNGPRREFVYEPDGLLVVAERIVMPSATPPYSLEMRMSYDAVLELPTVSTDWIRVEGGADMSPTAVSQYAYDSLGRLLGIAEPGDTLAAPTHEFSYEIAAPTSRIRSWTRSKPGGTPDIESVQCFDGLGRLVQKRDLVAKGQYQVSGFSIFDTRGKEWKRWQPYLGTTNACDSVPAATALATTVRYDGMGRPLETTHADASEYGGVPSQSRVEYRPLEERFWDAEDTKVGGPHYGTYTTNRHDGLARLVSISRLLTASSGQSFMFRYDSLGNLRGWRDDLGNEKRQTYDLAGRVVRVDDPDTGATTFTYDVADNLISKTDARGVTVRSLWDDANREVERWQDGNRDATLVRNQYDREPGCAEAWCAWVAGRHVRTTWASNGVNGEDRPTFDARGRVAAHWRRIGDVSAEVSTTYDNANRTLVNHFPAGVDIPYVLDGLGRAVRVGDYLPAVAYDARGAVSQVTAGNGMKTQYVLDSVLRLRGISTTGPAGDVLQALQYARDRVGNILAITDTAPSAHAWTENATYTYDAFYRLRRAVLDAERPSVSETNDYVFDSVDNLISKTSSRGGLSPEHVGPITYGPAGGVRPHAPASAAGTLILYDAAGQRILDGVNTYEWDHEGRLLRQRVGGEAVLELGYGADLHRVWRTEGDRRTYYFSRDLEIRDGIVSVELQLGGKRVVRIEVEDASLGAVPDVAPAKVKLGELVSTPDDRITAGDAWVGHSVEEGYLPPPEDVEVTSAELLRASTQRLLAGPKKVTYISHNHAGTAVLATDSEGEVLWRSGTTPYGLPRYESGQADLTKTFQGMETTADRGIALLEARALDLRLGRWLSSDPAFMAVDEVPDGFLGDANPYTALAGNSLNMEDRDGRAVNPFAWASLAFSAVDLAMVVMDKNASTTDKGLQAASFALDLAGTLLGIPSASKVVTIAKKVVEYSKVAVDVAKGAAKTYRDFERCGAECAQRTAWKEASLIVGDQIIKYGIDKIKWVGKGPVKPNDLTKKDLKAPKGVNNGKYREQVRNKHSDRVRQYESELKDHNAWSEGVDNARETVKFMHKGSKTAVKATGGFPTEPRNHGPSK